MIGWGVTFIIVGFVSFLLASTSWQFITVSIFSPHQTLAAVGHIVLGSVLIGVGLLRRSKGAE